MSSVTTLLSRNLKRAHDTIEQYEKNISLPTEENKVLFHNLFSKYMGDESIKSQIVGDMALDADGAYNIDPKLFNNFLILLLKKDRQEKEDELNFEAFRVKDVENQKISLKEQLTEKDERIVFLQKLVEKTEQFRADRDEAHRNLFTVTRERDDAQKRIKYIAEEVRTAHEHRLVQGREKANSEVTQSMEMFQRLADEICSKTESIDHKRKMAEIMDRLRLCVAINF